MKVRLQMTTAPTNKLQQIAATNKTVAAPVTHVVAPVGHNETANVKALILAIVQSLEMMDEERDAQKEVLERLFAEHSIDKKVARKVAKIIHKKNKAEFDQDKDDIDALYSRISK